MHSHFIVFVFFSFGIKVVGLAMPPDRSRFVRGDVVGVALEEYFCHRRGLRGGYVSTPS